MLEQQIKDFESWVGQQERTSFYRRARGEYKTRTYLWKIGQEFVHKADRIRSNLGHIISGVASGIKICCIKHFMSCSPSHDCGSWDRRDMQFHNCLKCGTQPAYKIFWHDSGTWSATWNPL